MMNMFGLRAELLPPGQKFEKRRVAYQVRFRNSFGKLEAVDPLIGEEHDELDKKSPTIAVFAVIDGQEQMVACARILLYENGPITIDPKLVNQGEPHGEVSRFTIEKSVGDRLLRQQIRFLLCSALAEYAFGELGYQTLYCDARLYFHHILHGCMGDSLETLGTKHVVVKNGLPVPMVPCCIRRASVPAIRARLIRMLSNQQQESPGLALAA